MSETNTLLSLSLLLSYNATVAHHKRVFAIQHSGKVIFASPSSACGVVVSIIGYGGVGRSSSPPGGDVGRYEMRLF